MGRHSPKGTTARDQELTKAFALVVLLVLAVVVWVLIARPFEGGKSGGEAGPEGGGLVVVESPALPTSQRYVGLVLDDERDLAEVLRRHGLPPGDAVSTGGGMFLVGVGERGADGVVRDLRRDPAVLTAGYVAEETSPAPEP